MSVPLATTSSAVVGEETSVTTWPDGRSITKRVVRFNDGTRSEIVEETMADGSTVTTEKRCVEHSETRPSSAPCPARLEPPVHPARQHAPAPVRQSGPDQSSVHVNNQNSLQNASQTIPAEEPFASEPPASASRKRADKKVSSREFIRGLNLNICFWKLLWAVGLLIFDFYSDVALLVFQSTGDWVITRQYDCGERERNILENRGRQLNCNCIHDEISVYMASESGNGENAKPLRYDGGCFFNDTGKELTVHELFLVDPNYIYYDVYQYEKCGCQRNFAVSATEYDSGPDWIDTFIIVYVSITITRELVRMVFIIINIFRRSTDEIVRPLMISESPFLILFLLFRPPFWNEMAVRVMSGELTSKTVMAVNIATEDLPSIIISIAILSDPWYSGSKASGKSPGPLPYLAIVASVLVVFFDIWRLCAKEKSTQVSLEEAEDGAIETTNSTEKNTTQ